MAAGSRRGPNELFALIQSPVTPIGNSVTIATEEETVKTHCFAGIQFFSDAAGTIQAIPTIGSVAITIRTINTTPIFEPTPAGTVFGNVPVTVSWAANTLAVKATPTGLDVATHYKLIVTFNES